MEAAATDEPTETHDVADEAVSEPPMETQALVDEAFKKAGLIWVTTPAAPLGHAFWHVWVGSVAYVLTGPGEQPDPRLADGDDVAVVVRSKDTWHRLLTLTAKASRLRPDDADWAAATTALAGSRLNLHDSEHAPERWADELFAVYRLEPTGEISEAPGNYSAESHRAAPVPSPATTQGKKPWVVHKRGHSGRPLS